jgi:putative intracellular protease/amidase
VALIGHAPAALITKSSAPIVAGRNLTCFSNSEELATGLGGALPYSLQDELIRLGANYGKAPDGAPHVVQDGALITGQNASSALDAARRLLEMLRQ